MSLPFLSARRSDRVWYDQQVGTVLRVIEDADERLATDDEVAELLAEYAAIEAATEAGVDWDLSSPFYD